MQKKKKAEIMKLIDEFAITYSNKYQISLNKCYKK